MFYFFLIVAGLIGLALLTLPLFFSVLYGAQFALNNIDAGRGPRFLLVMLKSLGRNRLRTSLTFIAIFVFVFMITGIWSILSFLSAVTEEKSKDLKAIVTEKHQLPSQMPFAYAQSISREVQSMPEGQRPRDDDLMTWQFYGGTLDPTNRTRENGVFFFALDPKVMRTMMDDLEGLDPQLAEALRNNMRGCILGKDRLKALNKRVGERMKVFSFNYKDIDLEFDIIGQAPDGRYDQTAFMNRDYLNRALEDYERKNGAKHPLAEKSLNLFWMRLPTTESFQVVAERMAAPGKFSQPSVKVETASSGISAFLDAYRDLVWAMRYLLAPAILVSMSLVIANAISISVRERVTEMAVLKVLGFRPWQILLLVLGEGLLIGVISGFLSSGLTYLVVDYYGGIKFPIAFFPAFFVPAAALWWGPVLGGLAALFGSILPAWSARTVKVSEVFSKVA